MPSSHTIVRHAVQTTHEARVVGDFAWIKEKRAPSTFEEQFKGLVESIRAIHQHDRLLSLRPRHAH